jgi:membrane protein DedA with SNARE-associated domain
MHGTTLPVALHAMHLERHLHHRFVGPHVDYVGLALAAAVSWVGIAGPGEAALIAAGIAAAHGRVDIVGMIVVAWAGAMAGGAAGWLIGCKGGRSLMTRPGPLYATRLRLLRHGDAVYGRRGWWLAVYLAPSWMAGVSGMRVRRFLAANAVASLIWAVAIGLGSYLVGPSIADAIGDVGTAGLIALGGFLVLSALIRGRRLQRRRRRP